MKAPWIPLLLTGVTLISGVPLHSAQAQSVYSLAADHAQGLVGNQSFTVKLWTGYGTNISFLSVDETLVRVWVDDPARVALDFDEPLCPAATNNCQAGTPSVIHLRRIQGLDFEHLPQANGTLLTVITETQAGKRQLYEFRIEFATGTPEYHTVAIAPVSPVDSLTGLIDIKQGLSIAEARSLIQRDQDLWNRLQTFLSLARQGVTVSNAAEQAGVSLEVVNRLAEWGATAREDPPLIPAAL